MKPPFQGRFRRLYLRHQRRKPSLFRKLLSLAGGVTLLLAGLVMLFSPGPGLLCLLLGAALVAQNSLFASELLDRIEPRAAGAAGHCRRLWKTGSPGRKALMAVAALLALLLPPFLVYKLLS